MTPAIQTRALTRVFDGGHGVRALDLDVPAGVVHGFLGPNGAGKTTTIRLLLGLLRPQAGDVRLFGRDLHADRAVLAQVGALVESPALYPHLSGRANLEVERRLRGHPATRVDAVLERVGLRADAGRRVREYSLGMRQRLGIALALLPAPRLLVLDEPGNGLDPGGIQDMRRLLRGFAADDGITVFVSSHQLSEVELVASHVTVLDAGRLRFQGRLDDLRNRARPRLRLRCDDPARALALLAGAGDDLRVDPDGRLSLRPRRDAAAINHQLVSAGIAVSELAPEPVTLESLYFDLTGAAAEREAA